MSRLSDEQIQAALASLPGWALEEGVIQKTFSFASYPAGLTFAVAAGHLAEKMDHHPDLFIGWRKVRVSLSTHDAGGITELDTRLASQIEALA